MKGQLLLFWQIWLDAFLKRSYKLLYWVNICFFSMISISNFLFTSQRWFFSIFMFHDQSRIWNSDYILTTATPGCSLIKICNYNEAKDFPDDVKGQNTISPDLSWTHYSATPPVKASYVNKAKSRAERNTNSQSAPHFSALHRQAV